MLRSPRIAALLLALTALLACDRPAPEPAPAPVEPAPTPPPLEPAAVLAPALVSLLEQHHLRHHPLTDDDAARAFDLWLERLDPAKMFLEASDVEALRKTWALRLDDQLRAGELPMSGAGLAALRRRTAGVKALVPTLLEAPVELDASPDSFDAEATRASWATDAATLQRRWRQTLTWQTLERLAERMIAEGLQPPAPGAPWPEAVTALEAEARAWVRDTTLAYLERILHEDPLFELEVLLQATAASFDPYTAWLPPARREAFDARLSGQVESVGLELVARGGRIAIAAVLPGSAAWLAGEALSGDLLLALGDAPDALEPVEGLTLDQVEARLRGPRGTSITLRLQRPGAAAPFTVTLTREVLRVETTFARGALATPLQRGERRRVAFLSLPGFYGNARVDAGATEARDSGADMAALLTAAREARADAVVIDLRGNEGGLVQEAAHIAGMLLDGGPIVQIQPPRDGPAALEDTWEGTLYDGPLVILVDRASASAAEILASALQDRRRAVIVGTSATWGKGTVQGLIDLDAYVQTPGIDALRPLGTVKLTLQQYYRVTGEATQLRGVTPDLLLPDPEGWRDRGEQTHPNAVPWSSIAPLPAPTWPTPPPLDALREASSARLRRQPLLRDLPAHVQAARDAAQPTPVPLTLAAVLGRKLRAETLHSALHTQAPRPVLQLQTLGLTAPTPAAQAVQRRWERDLALDLLAAEAIAIALDLERQTGSRGQ